jgi:hypothetical protein
MSSLAGMTTPLGDYIKPLDMTWLREMILHGGSEFWNAGSGEAAVDYGQLALNLIFHEDYGFYLAYHESDTARYVPWMLDECGRVVTVSTGGQPFDLPEALFVPRDLAAVVIEEFCRTGQRTQEAIRWKRSNEIPWDKFTGSRLRLDT